MVRYFVKEINTTYGVDVSNIPSVLHRIKIAAENIKITLDREMHATADLPYLMLDSSQKPIHITLDLDRNRFDNIIAPLVTKR